MQNYLLLLFFTFLLQTSAQNHQVRIVYYSPNQYICWSHWFDEIAITFKFESEEYKEENVIPGTYCEQWVLSPTHVIGAFDRFSLVIDDRFVYFDVDLVKVKYFGEVQYIYTNTTLSTKEVYWKHDKYICQLQGDGTAQHFNQKNLPPTASIKVGCKRDLNLQIE